LLVLGVLAPEVGSILTEVITLHVLSSLGLRILLFLVGHKLLECLLLQLQLLDLVLLLLLLLGQHGCLRFEDSKFVVGWCVLLELVIEAHAVLLEPLHVVCETFQLVLRGHWLLKQELDTLETFALVVELTPEDLVVQFPVLTCLLTEVFEHLVWAKVLVADLADVNDALLYSENLLLVELDHVGQLVLFLVQLRVLLLLLAQLGGRL